MRPHLTLFLAALGITNTLGFWPEDSWYRGAGYLGYTHKRITQEAWSQLATKYFSASLTNDMKDALQVIVDANSEVDKDQTHAELHFDGEAFPEGQIRLQRLASEVIAALKEGNGKQARSLLGSALHTVQDFYAHSNYIEMGNTSPHPDLGRAGIAMTRLGESVATCQDCVLDLQSACNYCLNNDLSYAGLTSGYYGGEDRKTSNLQKCHHGGILDWHEPISWTHGLTTQDGINKDSILCSFSPHWRQHDTAATVAIAATVQYISMIVDQVNNDQLRTLFATDPSMTIYSDRQMASRLRRSLGVGEMTKLKRSESGESDDYLIQIKGRDVRTKFLEKGFTTRQRRRRDTATQEDLNELYEAVANSPHGSYLFLYAQASDDISDVETAHLAALATSHSVKVAIFVFGSGNIDNSLYQLASWTGGQLFALQDSELDGTSDIIEALYGDDFTYLAYSETTDSDHVISYPVDSTLSNMTILVSGTTDVTLTRPDGSVLTASDPSFANSTTRLSTALMLTIPSPATGTWTISYGATNATSASLSVIAHSDISISFDFTRLDGRPGHQAWYSIGSVPPAGSTFTAESTVTGISTTANLSFGMRGADYTSFATQFNMTLADGGSNVDYLTNYTFYTTFNGTNVLVPRTEFFVYVTGVDNNGYPFQRLNPGIISPSRLSVQAPPCSTIHPGTNRTLTFLVGNNANASREIVFSALDNLAYVVPTGNQTRAENGTISTGGMFLQPDETREVRLRLEIPLDAAVATSDELTVTVRASSTNGTSQALERLVTSTVVSQWIVEGDALDDISTYDGYLIAY